MGLLKKQIDGQSWRQFAYNRIFNIWPHNWNDNKYHTKKLQKAWVDANGCWQYRWRKPASWWLADNDHRLGPQAIVNNTVAMETIFETSKVGRRKSGTFGGHDGSYLAWSEAPWSYLENTVEPHIYHKHIHHSIDRNTMSRCHRVRYCVYAGFTVTPQVLQTRFILVLMLSGLVMHLLTDIKY